MNENDPAASTTPPPPPPPQSPPPHTPDPAVPPGPVTPGSEERTWGMLAHLSALLGGLLTSWGGGIGVFIGPLIIWLIKKDSMPFVDDQGKESLNFNISVAIVALVLVIVTFITFFIGAIITVPLGFVLAIYWLVFTIIAAIKANSGEFYRYPISIRLIK